MRFNKSLVDEFIKRAATRLRQNILLKFIKRAATSLRQNIFAVGSIT